MDDSNIRVEALRLAIAAYANLGATDEQVVASADTFYRFLIGATPPTTSAVLKAA